MTRQLAFGDPELPPSFVDEWLRLEAQQHINANVVVDSVHRGRNATTTIALKVDGKRFAVINRSSPEAAARDLFTQAFGPIRQES